jgi:hypothetical protein
LRCGGNCLSSKRQTQTRADTNVFFSHGRQGIVQALVKLQSQDIDVVRRHVGFRQGVRRGHVVDGMIESPRNGQQGRSSVDIISIHRGKACVMATGPVLLGSLISWSLPKHTLQQTCPLTSPLCPTSKIKLIDRADPPSTTARPLTARTISASPASTVRRLLNVAAVADKIMAGFGADRERASEAGKEVSCPCSGVYSVLS